MLKFNLSPSAINLYNKSQLQFYFQYIKKSQPDTECVKCYGDFGSAVHEILEYYPKFNSIEDYDKIWKKYKLDINLGLDNKPMKKSLFYDSIRVGVKLLTEKYNNYNREEQISLSFIHNDKYNIDIKGIIDLRGDNIADWKTSSKIDDGVSFELQGKMYSYLVWKKHGFIPKKVIFEYVKINKTKSYSFTENDLVEFGKYIEKIGNEIMSKGDDISKYELGDYNNIFNTHLKKCMKEQDRRNNNPQLRFFLKVKGSKIYIMNKLSPLLVKGLKKSFSYEVKNVHFVRLNSNWDGIVRLYSETTQSISIGFRDRLIKVLNDYCAYHKKECIITIEDDFNPVRLDDFKDNLIGKILRDEQKEAVDKFIKHMIGVISACTGSGKTLIAGECIRRLGLRTLFLVDRIDLLQQTKKEFEDVLGVEVGIIGGGEYNPQWITIATVQTLAKDIKKYYSLLSNVQFVIVDECQIAASKGILNVVKSCFESRYFLGLSATPYRNDGNDMMIESILGKVVYELKTKDAQDKKYLTNSDIVFYHVDGDKTLINFREDLEMNITYNDDRNNIIKEEADKSISENKNCLILTKTIAHGELLNEMIDNSIHVYGATNKKVRLDAWNKMRNGTSMVVITTNVIASKGLNIPPLNKIINGAADGNDQAAIQTLGRVLRTYIDKDHGTYIDFLDEGKFTKKWSRIRMKALKNEGHTITTK